MPQSPLPMEPTDVRRDAILNIPLTSVLRAEIALQLQLLGIFTIGQFLTTWRDPAAQSELTALFDSPQQARHAVAVCANWLGGRFAPVMQAGFAAVPWWQMDESANRNWQIGHTPTGPTSAAA